MWPHPTLDPQMGAYENIVASQVCSSSPDFCPLEQLDGGLLHGLSPQDSCSGSGTPETSYELDKEYKS